MFCVVIKHEFVSWPIIICPIVSQEFCPHKNVYHGTLIAPLLHKYRQITGFYAIETCNFRASKSFRINSEATPAQLSICVEFLVSNPIYPCNSNMNFINILSCDNLQYGVIFLFLMLTEFIFGFQTVFSTNCRHFRGISDVGFQIRRFVGQNLFYSFVVGF